MKSGLAALFSAVNQHYFVDGSGNKKGEAYLTDKESAQANRDLAEEEVEHRWVKAAPSQYDVLSQAAMEYGAGEE